MDNFLLSSINLYATDPNFTGQFLSELLGLEVSEDAGRVKLYNDSHSFFIYNSSKLNSKNNLIKFKSNLASHSELKDLIERFQFVEYKLRDLSSKSHAKLESESGSVQITDPDGRVWLFEVAQSS